MNFSISQRKTFQELHRKALDIASNYRSLEIELLGILEKIDSQKVYRFLGYNSLFTYAHQELGLSEAQAYTYIRVSRKCHEFPKLRDFINQKKISIYKAKTIVPVLDKTNQDQLLEVATNSSKRELERMTAHISPKSLYPDKIRFITSDIVSLNFCLDYEVFQKIERAKELLTEQQKCSIGLEGVLESLSEQFLERSDPLIRAHRLKEKQLREKKSPKINFNSKKGTSDKTGPGNSSDSLKEVHASRKIPEDIKRSVILRDKNMCQFKRHDGLQCHSKLFLEFHHKKPFSQGGLHTEDNLTLLCAGHHKFIHENLKHPRINKNMNTQMFLK